MAKISEKISESLREYTVLTDWVTARSDKISLEARLGDSIVLQYPFMTARMQCLVGPRMAVTAGRNGILTLVSRNLRNRYKQEILDANNKARLKKGHIEYIAKPECADPETTLADVVKLIGKTGHSVIPILDQFFRLHGVYRHDPDNPPSVPPYTPIKDIMVTPRTTEEETEKIPTLPEGSPHELVRETIARERWGFVPMVDENMILKQLAFKQKYDTNFIGIAIGTGKNWEEELEMWGPQVDTLVLDSSNVCFEDALRITKEAKKRFPDKPFGPGNLIQGRHFDAFADAGADYLICGMAVGSICQTGSRGNGRGQFTVAHELAEARDRYAAKPGGRYVPIAIDGGIKTIKDMVVALSFGDLIVMCNYFNAFYEAAAKKLDENKNETNEEALIRFVEIWGEGHPRARLVAMFGMNYKEALEQIDPKEAASVLERYGQSSVASATVEGVVGHVEYRGRLKPCVEDDARYLRATVSNAGAKNLAEFREKAIVEKISPETLADLQPHDIEVTES